TALQSFSIRPCADVESRASKRATFGARNFWPSALYKLCRPKPDGQDGKDARGFDGCVRYAIGTRPNSFYLRSERHDTRFSPRARVTKPRSFAVDRRGVVQFFLQLRPRFCAIFPRRARDKFFRRCAPQTGSTIFGAPDRFSR